MTGLSRWLFGSSDIVIVALANKMSAGALAGTGTRWRAVRTYFNDE